MGSGASTIAEAKTKMSDLSVEKKSLAAFTLNGGVRWNDIQASPAKPLGKFAVIGFKVPGAENGGSDKGKDGIRVDTIPIINSVIQYGGACEYIEYKTDEHDAFVTKIEALDALIVRINPGQLSQGTPEGTQAKFDELMNTMLGKGKLVWNSPAVQTQMGAKDALVQIKDLAIGLKDTYAYYTAEDLEKFRETCAFQPRVVKQNRGSAGEGIWLCWLEEKEYCAKLGDAKLEDGDKLKLMEMNDNHVEHHTVKEFLTFCVGGPTAEGAGEWKSTFPGKYLEGGKEAGGQLVDQRLCPRIKEGEVRVLMVGDECQMIIHKLPTGGGLSAVGGNSEYTFYEPDDPKYAWLYQSIKDSLPTLMPTLGLTQDQLPILWTTDFIPKDPEAGGEGTEYVVGEFNCSCVGISKFQAKCGGSVSDVADEDYADGVKLTNMIGRKAVEFVVRKKLGA